MSWLDQIDRIYVINLLRRSDRRNQVTAELKRVGIPFSFWIAHEKPNGAEGLYETMMEIFEISVANNFRRVMILEDDVHFINDPHDTLNAALEELPANHWDMLYLGCNLPRPGCVRRFSDHLLTTTSALATHAVIYSKKAMGKILALPKSIPVDIMLRDHIQQDEGTFCTLPLLCVQYPGFSDIEKRNTDYKSFIQERYTAATINLFSQK